jgi:hypothetical protein
MRVSVQIAASSAPSLGNGNSSPCSSRSHNQENAMNKDQARGYIEDVKGSVKALAGKPTARI